ncbi:MAG: formate C-acetyltransferase/glycerol dehydratase family glycyl radical enzyme [Candidatus Lokiarchaeota archaeon]|nr:formate C-acetyltransferase/glycerol dehydratase family glycyl radical enzyme [Candidatus Lokiarchaeota archaeon]MBD3200992.1 formate C-acetyltransferase/glycerol dehydratase family glycyl radical enzyme [Candidatus Lokiarchaeota archaeon]
MNNQLLKEAVHNTPYLSLKVPISYTNVIKKNPGKPMIILQAEGLRETLRRLPIIIRDDELIVGTFDENIPVAIPRPEATGLRIVKELENLSQRSVNPINVSSEDISIFKNSIAPFWENYRIETFAKEIAPEKVFEGFYSGGAYVPTEAGGIAHAVINYPRLLSDGLVKYIKLADEKIRYYQNLLSEESIANEKIAFYRSIKIVAKAIIKYAHRYAQKAKDLAEIENDTKRKEELMQIHRTCLNVPANSPKNFHEAIQFIWFIHMTLHLENFEHGISFGRIDQYLHKYYDENPELTIQLLENLFLKTNEIIALYDSVATQYFGGMATTQGVVIGGINVNGEDATNELTYLAIKAFEKAGVPSPNMVLRCHKNTPAKLYQEVARLLSKGKNILGLYNDEVVTKALTRYGVSLKEARNYGIVGCVGLSTSGTSFDNTGAIFLNLTKAMECALDTDKTIIKELINSDSKIEEFKSMEQLLTKFKEDLTSIMKLSVLAANSYQHAHIKLKPTPLMSLCIDGCFEKGIDINKGSAKYNFSGIHVTGFADVVDSLAALEKVVFVDRKITMGELVKYLKKNFRGNKELMNYLTLKCPKYGSDNDLADKYAIKVNEIIKESIKGMKSARGDEYRPGLHAMTTHVGFGLFTGALPSGRRKGTPLIKDIAPGAMSEEGLTAAIKSITKVDHSYLGNGLACTLSINPEIAKMEDGKIFESLLRTYFKLGGSHIQFNAISPSLLKKAQQYPEEHANLMVRVSGYSARFTDLPKAVQDDIISRYCYGKI